MAASRVRVKMGVSKKASKKTSSREDQVRMPEDSFLYDRVVPAVLIMAALALLVIVLVVLGVLVGVIPYQ